MSRCTAFSPNRLGFVWGLSLAAWVASAPVLAQDQGLRLPTDDTPFQRLGLRAAAGSDWRAHVLGAHVLGDYYLSGHGAGLRLSGGLMRNPQLRLDAPVPLGLLGRFGTANEDSPQQQAFLGVGYSLRGDNWGFSADLGLGGGLTGNTGNGLRLGGNTPFAQGLDLSWRRLQWAPVAQLGVSYRF